MDAIKAMHRNPTTSELALAWALPWMVPCALLLASIFCVVWLSLTPRPGRAMLVVFPPWWTRTHAIAALIDADGKLVGLGNRANMLIAASAGPGFERRLRTAGALLLLDARGAAGCGIHSAGHV